MKKIVLPFLCIFILIFCVKPARAAETTSNDIFIKDNQIEQNKTINGDGIFIANNISVKGTIMNDLLSVSLYQTNNYSNVKGSIRSISGSFYNNGVVEKNLMVVAGEIYLLEKSLIMGNAYLLANTVNINSDITKDVYIYSSNINITAKIGGRLVIDSGTSNNIKIENIENIQGVIVHKGTKEIESLKGNPNYTFIKINTNLVALNNLKNQVSEFLMILLIGILFVLILTKSKYKIAAQKNHKKTVMIGFISLPLILFVILALATLTVICIYFKMPIMAIILLAIAFGLVAVLIFSLVCVMLAIGRVCRIKNHNVVAFIVGCFIYYVIVITLVIITSYFASLSLVATIISIAFRISTLAVGVGLLLKNKNSHNNINLPLESRIQ